MSATVGAFNQILNNNFFKCRKALNCNLVCLQQKCWRQINDDDDDDDDDEYNW